MRQKDADRVAWVLGREVRFAPEEEVRGLDAAACAIEAHMAHVLPEFDPNRYHAALLRGERGEDLTAPTRGGDPA